MVKMHKYKAKKDIYNRKGDIHFKCGHVYPSKRSQKNRWIMIKNENNEWIPVESTNWSLVAWNEFASKFELVATFFVYNKKEAMNIEL